MTIRDHGKGAYDSARMLASEASAENDAKSHRFWTAVAAEIVIRMKAAGEATED